MSEQAEPLYREALKARQATLGDEHPHTQNTAIGLWNVLRAKGGCEDEMAALDRRHGI